MSYRKITVDGKEYEYTIGRTHVKVKGVWTKEKVGEKFAKRCEFCGDPVDTIYSEEHLSEHDFVVEVHPKHIAKKIKQVSV
jgi:hypothetical protein